MQSEEEEETGGRTDRGRERDLPENQNHSLHGNRALHLVSLAAGERASMEKVTEREREREIARKKVIQ